MKQLKLFVSNNAENVETLMNGWIKNNSTSRILTVKIATRDKDILGIIIYEDYNNTKKHEKILFDDQEA